MPTEGGCPTGFVVLERSEPTALVPVDPYRDAERSLDLPVTLEVAWNEDNWDQRAVVVALGFAFPSLVFWASFLAGTAAAVAALVVSVAAFATLVRQFWDAKRWIRVDTDGIHWRACTFLSPLVTRHLAAADIAQLTVRDVTDRKTVSWPKEVFRLFVRDRAGIDHAIVDFPKPHDAWWLEQRIEHHLGIPDRMLPGELPKQITSG